MNKLLMSLTVLFLLCWLTACGAAAQTSLPAPAPTTIAPTSAPSPTLLPATAIAVPPTPTLVPPTAMPTGPSAEAVVRALLAAEQAGNLEQVMRAYDDSAFHLQLNATAGKDAASPTIYDNNKDELRTYWAALLQDHLTLDVVTVLVSTNVPPTFGAGLGGKAEQVTVRSHQSRDMLRQAGSQYAEVLDNYLIVAGKITSPSTIIAHSISIAATPRAPDAFPTGVYAATRNLPPPHVAFGYGFLVFAEYDRFYLITAGNALLDNGPYRIAGNRLMLTSKDTDCQTAGRSPDFTYQWALEAQLLVLTTVVDRCGSGHPDTFTSGPWTKLW